METPRDTVTADWVKRWQRTGPILDRIRRDELRCVSTCQALANLADAFESARLHFQPLPISGLVIQQAWFRRMRKC